MVGIPRSKGCTTCRRRKIRCDQNRPICQQCAKSKRFCEGYAHYPVFISCNQDGLVRTTRFAEVKPCPPVGLSSLNRTAWETNIICWFWRTAPLDKESWLRHAIEIPSPTVTLQRALLALSLTRFGRLHANRDVILQGQTTYSQALLNLQTVLYDSELALHDETLVSIRAMIFHEMYETTSNDPSSWQNHLAGITRLMQLRGPKNHRAPMTKAVFEDVRYPLVCSFRLMISMLMKKMLKALMLRKGSVFGQKEWRMKWSDPKQELYDLGFELAALLQQMDEGVYDVEICKQLHASFEELLGRLNDPATIANLLGCQLLLGFVMSSLGLDWTARREEKASSLAAMLPTVVKNGEEHRSIFPLTCLMWEYRDDQNRYKETVDLVEQVAGPKKLKFVKGTYQARNWIPNVAQPKTR